MYIAKCEQRERERERERELSSPKRGDSVCRLGASCAGGFLSLVTRPPPFSLWYSISSLMVLNLCFSEMKYF